MIPSGIRLYTWVDIDELLFRIQKERRWPDFLLAARAYWDGLILSIRTGHQDEAIAWLADIFSPRFLLDSMQIALESTRSESRSVPVYLEESEESAVSPVFRPTLTKPTVVTPHTTNGSTLQLLKNFRL